MLSGLLDLRSLFAYISNTLARYVSDYRRYHLGNQVWRDDYAVAAEYRHSNPNKRSNKLLGMKNVCHDGFHSVLRFLSITAIALLAACQPEVVYIERPAAPEPVAQVVSPDVLLVQPEEPEVHVDPQVTLVHVQEPRSPYSITAKGFMQALEQERSTCDGGEVTTQYDELIKKAVNRYWSIERRAYWCWLKAQMWTESDFRENVVSSARATGLLQIVPETFDEWSDRIGIPHAKATDAKSNIRVAAAYMEFLQDRWIWNRTGSCRIELAAASYNAGFGSILTAQRLSGMQKCWYLGINSSLIQVTGSHAKETKDYVNRIISRYEILSGDTWTSEKIQAQTKYVVAGGS